MPVRVYDIAKKLGIEYKEVLAKAKEMGIAAAKVPSSSLDKISAEWLEEEIIKSNPAVAARLATPKQEVEIKPAHVDEPIVLITAPPEPPPYLSPGGHVCTDYAGCSNGHPLRWCVHQSGLGNAIVDGTADLYNSCATTPKTCSTTCPCSWVPEDVWSWMTRSF